jgi:hypothetical protein
MTNAALAKRTAAATVMERVLTVHPSAAVVTIIITIVP